LQEIYKVVTNRFFIKINNKNSIITINNNFIIAKTKQLKTKNIKNCFYFISINIKSLTFNANKIALKKNIDKYIIFI